MVELSDKWLQRLMALAVFISDWSKDPSTKVGAVISEGNRIVSVGYNGFPRGIVDDVNRLNDRQTRLKYTIHAELNAILQARESVRGYYLSLLIIPVHPVHKRLYKLVLVESIIVIL